MGAPVPVPVPVVESKPERMGRAASSGRRGRMSVSRVKVLLLWWWWWRRWRRARVVGSLVREASQTGVVGVKGGEDREGVVWPAL